MPTLRLCAHWETGRERRFNGMSEASDKLSRSRQAIVDQLRRKERKGMHPNDSQGVAHGKVGYDARPEHEEPLQRGSGWSGRLRYATRTWWRHHPAHMAVEMATPVLADYASRRPGRLLAISAALGAAVVVVRPWKLISATGLLVAILKSSQVSTLVMSAMSAADYQRDDERQR
ncbi:MAG: hypothetical protein EOO54_00435 [Haliea sp.]|nr:MAG: hypothetical protein EOO54_00435 [Haliea sp.]